VPRWLARRLPPSVLAHPYIALYGLAMSASAFALAVLAMIAGPVVRVCATIAIVAGLATASFRCLPRAAAAANLFMFLKEMLYVQIPGAMDYFFTAGPDCVPGGPHFSYFYYQTFTSIVGYAAGAAGVALFHRYLQARSFRAAFWATTCFKIAASLVDVVLVARWNVALGVSDHVAYVFGDAMVYSAATMMDFMPAVLLISKLCPRGLETTMYALLAGFSNFGQSVSRTIGTVLTDEVFAIRTEAPGCDFSRLPALIVVCHCVLPLLVFPLAWLLVPATRVDAPLAGDEGSAGAAE
jgi:hypothetical protein